MKNTFWLDKTCHETKTKINSKFPESRERLLIKYHQTGSVTERFRDVKVTENRCRVNNNANS